MAYRGHCRCGSVRFSLEGKPILTAACHCTDCQRMTSGPYSLSALYSDRHFELLCGETAIGDCNSAGEHHFCKRCFSWTHTLPGALKDMVNIRTPLLKRAADFPPFADFFLKDGLPGVESGAPRKFDGAPSVDEFLGLSKTYAQWSGSAASQ